MLKSKVNKKKEKRKSLIFYVSGFRSPFTPWVSRFMDNLNQTNCTSDAYLYVEEPGPPDTSPPINNMAYLSVYQILASLKNPNVMLGYVCNNEHVVPIRSSANKMIIEYKSASSSSSSSSSLVSPRGFKLSFTSVGRGKFFFLFLSFPPRLSPPLSPPSNKKKF